MILVQLLLATALVAAGANGQPAGSSPGPGYTQITKADAETMVAKCGTRKFETYVDMPADGKIGRKKFTLCAPDSDTQAAWISKLEKAAAVIEANPGIPQPSKLKLLRDFRAEITRQKAMPTTSPLMAAKPQPAPQGQPTIAQPIASPIAPVAMTPPKPADIPPYVPSAGIVNRLALVARCVAPGTGKSQPCEEMAPNERLEIRAESDIASPVSLLFRQTGKGLLGSSDKEAEVELSSDGMRRGETVLLRVPKRICSGFRSRFEVEVRTKDKARANQSPYVLGPFEMRCES